MSFKSSFLEMTWTETSETVIEVASMGNFPGKSLTEVYVFAVLSVENIHGFLFTHVKQKFEKLV